MIGRRALVTSGFIAALILVSSFFSVQAFAAEESGPRESITLSPVKERFTIDAGSTRSGELTIVNDGETAYDFIVYARPYSITPQDEVYSNPDFTTQTPVTDVYQWVQFDKARYHIEAGKTTKIGYTIRVPQNAKPGGHYGVLFAETQPTDSSTSNSVARKKRVGMVVYATVNGQYQMGGENLGAAIPWLQFRAPLTASARVKNTGNSDFVVESTYRVTDVFGSEKYRAVQEFVVLPQTTRKLTLSWDRAPWFGLFRSEVKTSFLDQNYTSSSYVLLTPRWLLIVLAVAVAGGILYAVVIRRR